MRLPSLSTACLELSYFQRAFHDAWILGVDEVGRGALAGPILAACCAVRAGDPMHAEVRDSKQMTSDKRRELYAWIRAHHRVSLAAMTHDDIDSWGVGHCNREIMRRALMRHPCVVNKLPVLTTLVDGTIRIEAPLFLGAQNIIKGDRKSYAIACASIVAKHVRDYLMRRLSRTLPGYGFDVHKGYATSGHIRAIRRLGMSYAHRRSFCQSVLADQRRLF